LLLLQGGSALNLLQWNPHWECFEQNLNNCKEEFANSLSSVLVQSDIDFANVVEYNDDHRRLPVRWKAMDHKCGLDQTTLIYNSDRWRLPPEVSSGMMGCMAVKDRPFIVQQFTEAPAWGGVRKVIVVGAHYPHTQDRTSLISALQSVVTFSGEHSVVLLADTNVNRGVPNTKILAEIKAPAGSAISSALHATCCLNTGFREEMAYDRIIANFGFSMTSSIFLDPPPAWAQGEFHKPIKATLVDMRAMKTSTTTTTRTTHTSTATRTTTTTTTTTTTCTPTTTSTRTTTATSLTSTTTTTTGGAVSVIFMSIGALSSCSVAAVALCGAVFGRRLFSGSQPLILHQRSIASDTAEAMLPESPDQAQKLEESLESRYEEESEEQAEAQEARSCQVAKDPLRRPSRLSVWARLPRMPWRSRGNSSSSPRLRWKAAL